jgi:ABC-type uncharacterized transport system involved in gliding motility auxiliary subunit
MERMRRNLSAGAAYLGLVALIAWVALPSVRPGWSAARPWLAAIGALLLLAGVALRLDYGRRVTRYGLNTLVLILLVVGVIAFVEAVSYRHNARLDLTENRRNSLSPQTIQLLRNLATDVVATGFFRTDQPGRKTSEDLLKQYARYGGGRFTWKMADPDREPGLARRYGVEAYGTIVLETKDKSEKVTDAEEEKLTNGLVKVTREGKRTVYVLAGHGEAAVANADRGGLSEAKAAMEGANYDVKELTLAREGTVPADAALVILAGPRTDLLKPELEALDAYVAKGGKLFVMADAHQAPALTPFLAQYGITLQDDRVIEVNPIGQVFGIGPDVPIIQQYEQHPITNEMRGVMTLFPLTRSLKPAPPGGKFNAQPLARTSPQSWGETDRAALARGLARPDPPDARGPLTVAAVASADKARLVVFGTSLIATNQFFNIQGNRDLLLNTVSWLAEEEDQISIRPKDTKRTPVMLSAQQGQLVFLLPVVVIPGLALVAGVVVFAKRRAHR